MANQWLTGSGVPSTGIGQVTDYYRDTASNLVYYRENAFTWTVVPAFTPNPDGIGTTWLHGNAPPLTGQGSDGDYYYDEVQLIVYRKEGATWVPKGSLDFIGIYGVQWGNGLGAPASTVPLNALPAGSFYLNVETSDIYFKNPSLVWEAKGQLGIGSTGLDAIATAADRVQTGLDRVATAADRVQTGLDVIATNADAVATAADRVQTGLDRVQTGADVVATAADAEAAEVAKNAAEAAILYHNIYSSTALGIAATSNGQRFLVSTANTYKYGLYNNNAGVAVYIGELDFIDGTILVQNSVIYPNDIFFAFRDRATGRSPFAILNDVDGTIVNQYIKNIKTNADKAEVLYVEENPNSDNIAWGVRVNSTTTGEKAVMLGFTYDGMLINPAFQELYAAVFGSGGTGTGDLAEADTIILHFPYIFAIENRELSFYAPSLLPNRNRNKLAYQFCIQSINSVGVPLVAEFSEYIRIPSNALGTTGVIKIKNENVAAEFSKNLTIIKSAAAKTGSPVVLMIGDSLTQGSQNAVASQLALTSMTPSYIGSRRLTGGIYGEGRGGWRAADFVYINTQFTPLPAGQEGVALGLNNDQRNPFIRVATGGDDSGDVKNGYIFDFSFYLTRFGFATPNVVTINLGTNDINNDAAALANIAESLRIMIKSIRATAPSCKIGIALPQNGNSTYFNAKWYAGFYPLFLSLHQTYGASSGSNIYLISSHAMLPDRFVYPMTTASTNANTGQVKQTLSDGTHFTADTYGLSLYAESIMSFIHAIS